MAIEKLDPGFVDIDNAAEVDKQIESEENQDHSKPDRSIDATFAFRQPSADGLERVIRMKRAYSILLRSVIKECPSSRERSLAITYLEESLKRAEDAVVINDPTSKVILKQPDR